MMGDGFQPVHLNSGDGQRTPLSVDAFLAKRKGRVCSFHDYASAPGDHPQPFNIQFT
jgi:hypothetical protein